MDHLHTHTDDICHIDGIIHDSNNTINHGYDGSGINWQPNHDYGNIIDHIHHTDWIGTVIDHIQHDNTEYNMNNM